MVSFQCRLTGLVTIFHIYKKYTELADMTLKNTTNTKDLALVMGDVYLVIK